MKNIDMGVSYTTVANGLVRTVCRATNPRTNEQIITYAIVGNEGCVSDIFFLPESEFLQMILS